MKSKEFVIDSKTYSSGQVLVIAELGSSHSGDPVKARELIDAASEAGADCIKFQIVYANEILHPNTGEVALPGGKIRLYDRFKALEQPLSFFAEMKEMVEKKGLVFLCTPFGLKSARELYSLNPKCIKIASPELNFTALLREIASYKLPTLLSSGVSSLSDIGEAMEILGEGQNEGQNIEERQNICLLHCVTAYPAPETDYNLRLLENLSSIFSISVGISDHSLDPCLVPALGTAMGASVIEKHFCLSRKEGGLDDPIALEPAAFAQMVAAIRKASKTPPKEVIEGYSSERGKDLVKNILGDGEKCLAPSETANYGRTNRSIHALRQIEKGELIERDMFACLRTEKNLRPGLSPSLEEWLIGRLAKDTIPGGEGIRREDVAETQA